MPGLWTSLRPSYSLEDVQAGLNIVITVLSTLGIFVFSCTSWQRAVKQVVRDKNVPLHTLLTLNTPGEAFDLVLLLGSKIFSTRYASLLVQCIAVICLSITAILAGLIGRYSSRIGHVVGELEVSGLLAVSHHNSISYANVEWNSTHNRLDDARFPLDQLLDYLPDNRIAWTYEASQWNSSWSMDCQSTPQTDIDLEANGKCTGIRDEVPALVPIYTPDDYQSSTFTSTSYSDRLNNTKDGVWFFVAFNKSDYDEAQSAYRRMDLALTTFYMHNAPRNSDSISDCHFGNGTIEQALYTQTKCQLTRNDPDHDPSNIAYPDIRDDSISALPDALTAYYGARLHQESSNNEVITMVSPDEIIRFYQVYTITKDTQHRRPVTRTLSVNLNVVQVSTIFLVIASLVALCVILGLLNTAYFTTRHFKLVQKVPQSKVDWMIQSIHSEDPPSSLVHLRGDWSKHRVILQPSRDLVNTHRQKRGSKDDFEAAMYGHHHQLYQSPVPHTESQDTEETFVALQTVGSSPDVIVSPGIHSPPPPFKQARKPLLATTRSVSGGSYSRLSDDTYSRVT